MKWLYPSAQIRRPWAHLRPLPPWGLAPCRFSYGCCFSIRPPSNTPLRKDRASVEKLGVTWSCDGELAQARGAPSVRQMLLCFPHWLTRPDSAPAHGSGTVTLDFSFPMSQEHSSSTFVFSVPRAVMSGLHKHERNAFSQHRPCLDHFNSNYGNRMTYTQCA